MILKKKIIGKYYIISMCYVSMCCVKILDDLHIVFGPPQM